MAVNKGTHSQHEHPIKQDFPEAKDKIVEIVELTVEPDYYGIEIRFHDKTALNFTIESRVVTFPVYSDFTGGEEKVLKQYRTISSRIRQ